MMTLLEREPDLTRPVLPADEIGSLNPVDDVEGLHRPEMM